MSLIAFAAVSSNTRRHTESRDLEYLNYSADIFKGKRSPQVPTRNIMKKKQINSGIGTIHLPGFT